MPLHRQFPKQKENIMKQLIFFITLFFINGCGTVISVPIDSTPISQDKATLIIYHEQGLRNNFMVFIDHKPVGIVTSEKPLKIAVEPGKHDLYIEVDQYNEVTTQMFNKNQTYYMKTWVDINIPITLRIEPTEKVDTFKGKKF